MWFIYRSRNTHESHGFWEIVLCYSRLEKNRMFLLPNKWEWCLRRNRSALFIWWAKTSWWNGKTWSNLIWSSFGFTTPTVFCTSSTIRNNIVYFWRLFSLFSLSRRFLHVTSNAFTSWPFCGMQFWSFPRLEVCWFDDVRWADEVTNII